MNEFVAWLSTARVIERNGALPKGTTNVGIVDSMRKYRLPEEVPGLLGASVDEIEADLRSRFPGVFRAARLRTDPSWSTAISR